MHRQKLLLALENYRASKHITPDEHKTVFQFIQFITTNSECFKRSNNGHITGSAWVVSADNQKALLTHHKKLNLWLQVGGHAEEAEAEIEKVALREAKEESGIENLGFVIPTIFDIDIHPIPSTCMYHYDIRYLLRAPEGDEFRVSDESHDLAWVNNQAITPTSYQASIVRMNEKFIKHFGTHHSVYLL